MRTRPDLQPATAEVETTRPPTPTTRTRPDPGMSSSLSLSMISSALGSQDPLTRPWRGSEMMICFTMSTIKRTLTIIKEQEMIMILIWVTTSLNMSPFLQIGFRENLTILTRMISLEQFLGQLSLLDFELTFNVMFLLY